MPMKFSVIIPCHNAGPWIAQSLQSVAAQSFPPCEIIVVNDASTDDSAEKIKSSGVDVRLLETSFRNGAAARNEGGEGRHRGLAGLSGCG
jgi:glycosyltransferase involved in cell wall biosynthesis